MKSQIPELDAWYNSYAASFRNGDPQLENAVMLKYDHTRRVVCETMLLCETQGLDRHQLLLGECAALLHDIARFEQFRKYGTFSDSRSENHATMGVRIIDEHRLLDSFTVSDAEDVRGAVAHHNAVRIPELPEGGTLLCRIIRDADKLDIYRIALDHYVRPDPVRRETVQVGIPDGDTVSTDVCESVLKGETVLYERIKTIADFKMIQLGWVYDLNFPHSFRCVHERGYIDNIAGQLPDDPQVKRAVERARRFVASRMK